LEAITLETIKHNETVKAFIIQADAQLEVLGFTEHGFRHASIVSSISANILNKLNYPKREAELAAIAGFMHDLGNVVSRHNHPQIGAVIGWQILRELKMEAGEIAKIEGAIGNHEETEGDVVSIISAAQIIADKSDVHKSRVRNPNTLAFDIHDRVNYAAEKSFLKVDKENKSLTLELKIDTSVSQIMEYFEIFLERMLMCRKAAKLLNCEFGLKINEVKLL